MRTCDAFRGRHHDRAVQPVLPLLGTTTAIFLSISSCLPTGLSHEFLSCRHSARCSNTFSVKVTPLKVLPQEFRESIQISIFSEMVFGHVPTSDREFQRDKPLLARQLLLRSLYPTLLRYVYRVESHDVSQWTRLLGEIAASLHSAACP